MTPETLKSVARFDRGQMRGKTERTKEGYLRADAAVTRIGVFSYVKADGTVRRELRHPSEVFKADSLSSLRLKPVTNDHPPTRLLDSTTAKTFQIGYTGEDVRQADSFVMSPLVITDANVIAAVDKGKRELSCGYSCDLVPEVGEFEGQKYDHKQENIVYNHVAVVDKGRAGSDVGIKMDSLGAEDAIEVFNEDDFTSPQRSRPMNKITLDGIEYDASPEVINAFRKAEKATTDTQAKLDALTVELEKTKADRDTATARVTELSKVDTAKVIADAVKSRIDLERSVAGILPEDTKIDSLTDKDIKVAVIKVKFPEAKTDDASDVYIQARFDSSMELVKQDADNTDAMAKQRQASGTRKVATDNDDGCDSETARKRYMDRMTGKDQKK